MLLYLNVIYNYPKLSWINSICSLLLKFLKLLLNNLCFRTNSWAISVFLHNFYINCFKIFPHAVIRRNIFTINLSLSFYLHDIQTTFNLLTASFLGADNSIHVWLYTSAGVCTNSKWGQELERLSQLIACYCRYQGFGPNTSTLRIC